MDQFNFLSKNHKALFEKYRAEEIAGILSSSEAEKYQKLLLEDPSLDPVRIHCYSSLLFETLTLILIFHDSFLGNFKV
jgi:hypothetical protein